MLLIKCVVFVIAIGVLSCHSEEVRPGQGLKRDTNRNLQKILDILAAQDEKINRIHTMAVSNQFLPKCTTALKKQNRKIAKKCWKDLVDRVKVVDQSTETEIQIFNQLVRDAYDGEESRLMSLATFIKTNTAKGSELAISGYESLLDAMDTFGHLYLKEIPTDNGLGSGLVDYTYRTLIQIRDAEGETSPIFQKTLPAVTNTILSGKEVYIRNNMTGGYIYSPDVRDAKIRIDRKNVTDPRCLWKLKPVESRWKEHNQESFYIVNSFDNKIITVGDGGSLKVSDTASESTWSMFYIRLVHGSSGEEVAIHCSFWGMKTLCLTEKDGWRIPMLLSSKTLEPSAVWLLEPKE